MTRHIEQQRDNAQTQALIARIYEIARNGAADAGELSDLDAQIQAGLAAAYGEGESLLDKPLAA